jgi:SAM-dependent methyltransferase
MSDEARAERDAWRAVAAGWERQQATWWDATLPVSERLVGVLDPRPGETILELAAGIGETGFVAASRLGPGGRLLSTDVAPEMVDGARRRAALLGGLENVEFRVADAAALELGDTSVDGILCRFGIMLVVEPPAAAAEMARVLRPGGRVALSVWASADENPWIAAAGRAAVELGLLERPGLDAPGPFRFADSGRLVGLLESAGLSVTSVEDVPIVWRVPSLDDWWDATRDMSRMISVLLERLDDGQAALLRTTAETAIRPFVGSGGAVAVPGLARVARAQTPR